MPRLPLTISFSRTYETPIRSASSAWVMPSGLMNSSSSISPGGVGGRSDGILTCAISLISSVIVHDLDVFGAGVGPPEARPPLIVDPDREVPYDQHQPHALSADHGALAVGDNSRAALAQTIKSHR